MLSMMCPITCTNVSNTTLKLRNYVTFFRALVRMNKTRKFFNYEKKCGRFVGYKYFSNFLGTVPTFGFRISIV